MVGSELGSREGSKVGMNEGLVVTVGIADGNFEPDGREVGDADGSLGNVGLVEGDSEGWDVGNPDGSSDGLLLGGVDGNSLTEGDSLGCKVRDGVEVGTIDGTELANKLG